MTAKRRVLLTGSAGRVGTAVREWVRGRWDLVCFDRVPTPGFPDAIVGDLSDPGALDRAAAGCDAIVHLAARPNPADFLSKIMPANVVGAWNLFEAAVRAKVRRVVVASTLQVEFGHPKGTKVSVDMAPRPSNTYAASKVWTENLGRIYARRHGLSVVALRFGMVVPPHLVDRYLEWGQIPSEITLTGRDACEIVVRAVEKPGIDFAVLPAFSRNARDIRDLSPLKEVLDYEPQDDAFMLWPARRDPHEHMTLGHRLHHLRHDLGRWWARIPGRARRAARSRRVRSGRRVRRVLVTGSAGYVGTAFRKWAGDRYRFTCFDRVPTPGVPDAIVGDLRDRAAVDRAMRGADAVLHLGGARDPADFMSVILPDNIIGTCNVYESAARAGVSRVVFASTLQADEGWPRGTRVSVDMPARPLNLYAAAKVLGEDLGRTAAFRTGLPVIALRLGWVMIPEDPEWKAMEGTEPPAVTVTIRDCFEVFARALAGPKTGTVREACGFAAAREPQFALLPVYSRNAAGIRDLSPLKDVLGYEPQDDPVKEFRGS